MKDSYARAIRLAVLIASVAAVLAATSLLQNSASGSVSRLVNQIGLNEPAAQSSLRARLTSTISADFDPALEELARLDQPGVMGLWEAAISNANAELRKKAWAEFQRVRIELMRKEFVPQVARVSAGAPEVRRQAERAGLQVNIWSESVNETVAAVPTYLLEALNSEGIATEILYSSIAEWKRATVNQDQRAISITPEYQSEHAASKVQVRIAVVDLKKRTPPAPGYSDWLGDPENILFRNDDLIAYLDIYSSDDSVDSANRRIEEQYSRRGYALAGFFTIDEFTTVSDHFFPGSKFNLRGETSGRKGALAPALSEGRFHSYEEARSELSALAQSHPEVAQLVNLGPSYEGRQIFALKVSRSPEVDDAAKPDVLITGAYHAREWISVEPPIYFAQQLVNGYNVDDEIKYLVDHLQIWIVPIVNPDGLTYSQGAPNASEDSIRLWRKNRRPVNSDCAGLSSSVGVDLNRNYGFSWRLNGDLPCNIADDIGASDIPASELFRGARPDSELELKAIKSLTEDPAHHFRAQLDFHNYSQLILYPWGFQENGTTDSAMLSVLAARVSEQIFSVDGRRYKAQQAINLYPTTGSSLDYAYGVDRIPGSLTIEMRPGCCGFTVPENEISASSQENWAGAKVLLNWAAGPPFLESVKAFQVGRDGNMSKQVYAANWQQLPEAAGFGRRFVLETRFPTLEPGFVQIRLQFSRPMDAATVPTAFLGRGAELEQLKLTAIASGGWQKTVYQNDTWVGEVIISPEENLAEPWRLSVSASDRDGNKLDAKPESIASYSIGTSHWRNFEDANGIDFQGGTDRKHTLAPTFPSSQYGLIVGAPGPNDRLAARDVATASWNVPKALGLVPTSHEIWLAVDGGVSFTLITPGIAGNVDKSLFVVPPTPTTEARLRVIAYQGGASYSVYGDSTASFTIGTNITSGCEITFLSSEVLNLGWSTPYFDGTLSGASQLGINIRVTNRSSIPIANPFIRVADLSRNVAVSRDANSAPGIAAVQSTDAGGDNILSPGESAQLRLLIGLTSKKKFGLALEIYGVPIGGAIPAGSPVNVWRGKPRASS